MKNIVITGANRGIGLELATQFSLNYSVFTLCRKSSSNLSNLSNVTVIEDVDLLSTSSIRNAISQLPDHIDVLINNAGILNRVVLDLMTDDDLQRIRDQFEVNALAPLFLVNQCLSRFKSGSKVALITSRMGSIDDNDSGSHYGYRMSKSALNMAGKSMAIDLNSLGISVGIIHPGWVKTGMTGNTGHFTTKQSAELIIDRIHELNLSNSGTFWHCNGSSLPW